MWQTRSIPFLLLIGLLVYTYPIPIKDLAFVILYSTYLFAAHTLRFDNNRPAKTSTGPTSYVHEQRLQFTREPRSDLDQKWFAKYIGSFAIVGVLLPILVLVLPGYQNPTAKIAAPHLFLLLSQIVMEHTVSHMQCHGYIMCLVPIGFSLYRQGSLWTWAQSAYQLLLDSNADDDVDSNNWQVHAGLVLAIINNIMWTYNTFVFLLLRVMPVYIDAERFPIAEVAWKYCGLIPIIIQTTPKQS